MLPVGFYSQLAQSNAFNDPFGQSLAVLAAANQQSTVVTPTVTTQDSSNSTTPTGEFFMGLSQSFGFLGLGSDR